jgi:integrase
MNDLVISECSKLDLVKLTASYAEAAQAENTIRAYESRIRLFRVWCERNHICHFPASSECVALYISSIAAKSSWSTIDVTIAAIENYHKKRSRTISGDPELYRNVRKGIRRSHKEKSVQHKAKALSIIDLAALGMLDPSRAIDVRDRVVILLLFFGALRRSELVGLDLECITITSQGIKLVLLQTKTSDAPETVTIGRAHNKSICPVYALEQWLELSKITSGPIIIGIDQYGRLGEKRLTGEAIRLIMIKRFGPGYSGHSGRRGLITEEARMGINPFRIADHSRHKDFNVMRGYVEQEQAFDTSSTKLLGV